MTSTMSKNENIQEGIKKYSDTVYRLAFSQTRNYLDADDVFQEVFFRYIKTQPRFFSEEHRKAWFLRVTLNCCKKIWLSSWYKKVILLEDKDMIGEQSSVSFELPEENDLFLALRKLSKKYRTVIHLFYYEDMSIAEISETLKERPSTVRTQLTRARKQLKKFIKEEEHVSPFVLQTE
jgi:RNA polymerase sigma-70 factor (ECF subfamily)